jgi:hypothetical protein
MNKTRDQGPEVELPMNPIGFSGADHWRNRDAYLRDLASGFGRIARKVYLEG